MKCGNRLKQGGFLIPKTQLKRPCKGVFFMPKEVTMIHNRSPSCA
nr:MAG TPA: hypothetical protein [Caudoviricetes sp.]